MSKPIKSIICGAGDMAPKHIEAYIHRICGHEFRGAGAAGRSHRHLENFAGSFEMDRQWKKGDLINASSGNPPKLQWEIIPAAYRWQKPILHGAAVLESGGNPRIARSGQR